MYVRSWTGTETRVIFSFLTACQVALPTSRPAHQVSALNLSLWMVEEL